MEMILGIAGIVLWIGAIVLCIMFFRAAFRIEQHLGRIADCLERQAANK